MNAMKKPINVKHPNTRKANLKPSTKANATSGETESKLGGAPLKDITVTTILVANATLRTFAEFLTSCVNADTTPKSDCSTALKIELLFGELNSPRPALWSINIATIKIIEDVSVEKIN